jgi:hypothetical protein
MNELLSRRCCNDIWESVDNADTDVGCGIAPIMDAIGYPKKRKSFV